MYRSTLRTSGIRSLFVTIGAFIAAILGGNVVEAQAQQNIDLPGYSLTPNTPVNGRVPPEHGVREKAVGSVPSSAAGTVGQRRDSGQRIGNIRPMARIETRVANRVQSRIRNRIDRTYDPEANALSPFKIATQNTQADGTTSTRE